MNKGIGLNKPQQSNISSSNEGGSKKSASSKSLVIPRDQVASSPTTASDLPGMRKSPAVIAPTMALPEKETQRETAEPNMQRRRDLYDPEDL